MSHGSDRAPSFDTARGPRQPRGCNKGRPPEGRHGCTRARRRRGDKSLVHAPLSLSLSPSQPLSLSLSVLPLPPPVRGGAQQRVEAGVQGRRLRAARARREAELAAPAVVHGVPEGAGGELDGGVELLWVDAQLEG